MAEALGASSTLQSFKFYAGCTSIGKRTGTALVEALRVNSTLRIFACVGAHTHVGEDMGTALVHVFEDSISLTKAEVTLGELDHQQRKATSERNLILCSAGRALAALARPSEDMGFWCLKERCFRLELLSYFLPAGSRWRPVGLASADGVPATIRLRASQP